MSDGILVCVLLATSFLLGWCLRSVSRTAKAWHRKWARSIERGWASDQLEARTTSLEDWREVERRNWQHIEAKKAAEYRNTMVGEVAGDRPVAKQCRAGQSTWTFWG